MAAKLSNIPERCCLKCHFCNADELHGSMRIERLDFDEDCRRRMAEAFSLEGKYFDGDVGPYANCLRGCYRYKKGMTDDFLLTDRTDKCFFYPYTESMTVDAATEIERRAADRGEAEKDRRHTRNAFWVAIGALVVSILATIANLVWNVWMHFYPLTR